jgi:hypothetical protein
MLNHHGSMKRLFWAAGIAAALVGCGSTPNPRSCIDGTCTSEEFPFCDVDGSFSNQPQTCIAVECMSNELAGCRDDNELRCNAEGTNYNAVDCPRGCVDGVGCRACEPNETVCANGSVQTCDAAGNVTANELCPLGCFESEPRCRRVSPSNFSASIFDMAGTAPDLDLVAGTINTDTGSISVEGGADVIVPNFLVTQQDGPGLRVFVAKRATIGRLNIVGLRAFALATQGPIVVDGPITIAAGAGTPTTAQCDAGPSVYNGQGVAACSGGGGGGNATAGGRGGNVSGGPRNYAGGTGGLAVGNETLIPLHGGCHSGGATDLSTTTASRAQGGGALQLTSGTSITIRGLIKAPGDAGEIDANVGIIVVYGGGAGGSILLEAPKVELEAAARVLAKGGAGGTAAASVDPTDDATPNLGAICGGLCGNAGNGGTIATPPTNGQDVTRGGDQDANGGGGGGAAGRFRVNTLSGQYIKSSGAIEAAVVSVGAIQTR